MSTVIIITVPPDVIAAVDEALKTLPPRMDSPEACAMLYTITLQEDPHQARRQIISKVVDGKRKLVPEGPAKSLWQGEESGGMCAGILHHKATREYVLAQCKHHGVQPTRRAIWDAIEHNDVLAAALARLLLWSDPKPLPALGRIDLAFALYLRTWRPGAWTNGTAEQREHLKAKWAKNYQAAVKAVRP